MSMQCWCFSCAGKIVVRSTFRAHGRKDKPDEPLRPTAAVAMASMPPESKAVSAGEESDVSDWSDEDADDLLGLDAPAEEADRAGKAELTVAEVTLFLLDWMCAHKATDSQTKDLWSIVQMLLPGQVSVSHTLSLTLSRTLSHSLSLSHSPSLCLSISL